MGHPCVCRKCNEDLEETLYQGSSVVVKRMCPVIGITKEDTLEIDFEDETDEDYDYIDSWYECIACGEEYTYEEALAIQKEIQEVLRNEI
jgi:hypothetical protein